MWPEQPEGWNWQHDKRKTAGGAGFRGKVSSALVVLSLQRPIRHSSGGVESKVECESLEISREN